LPLAGEAIQSTAFPDEAKIGLIRLTLKDRAI